MRLESDGTPIDIMMERLKLLPRRLRVVHLRALIGRQASGSVRGRELASLLHNEMMSQAGESRGLR
jgi:hypothetical protein